MSDKIKEIIDEIEAMKVKLSEEIAQQEKHISYEIKNGYVRFEKDILERYLFYILSVHLSSMR